MLEVISRDMSDVRQRDALRNLLASNRPSNKKARALYASDRWMSHC